MSTVEFRITTKRSNFVAPSYEMNDKPMVCPGKKVKNRQLGPGNTVEYSDPLFSWGNKFAHTFNKDSKKDQQFIKFLKNHPLCENSPTWDGTTAYFRFIDPEEVSKKAILAQMDQKNALAAVMSIVDWTGPDNKDITIKDKEKFALLGYVCTKKEFSASEKSEPLGKILQIVSQNPKLVLNCLRDGKAKFEKMIVDAVKFGVLKKKGAMYWFGPDNCIGNQATLMTMISEGKDSNSKRVTAAIAAQIEEAQNQ